jgi:hypothetical protein
MRVGGASDGDVDSKKIDGESIVLMLLFGNNKIVDTTYV